MARKMNGSTTVAGTMYLAHLAGIKIFVTGGIGGVHRGAEQTFDISADLLELSKTPVGVVCAGVKSILDIPKTLEYLETMGVPVVSYGSDDFPDFFTRSSGCKSVFRCDTPDDCAAMVNSQFNELGLQTGMIFAVPIPEDKAADSQVIKGAISTALAEADEQRIGGAEITPFLLKRVNELTGGESSASNVELIKNNAQLGARIAVQLSLRKEQPRGNLASLQSAYKLTIIGGAAVDIISKCSSELQVENSNIGKIFTNAGGTTRNTAECLGRLGLGHELIFVSGVGDDDKSVIISNSLE